MLTMAQKAVTDTVGKVMGTMKDMFTPDKELISNSSSPVLSSDRTSLQKLIDPNYNPNQSPVKFEDKSPLQQNIEESKGNVAEKKKDPNEAWKKIAADGLKSLSDIEQPQISMSGGRASVGTSSGIMPKTDTSGMANPTQLYNSIVGGRNDLTTALKQTLGL